MSSSGLVIAVFMLLGLSCASAQDSPEVREIRTAYNAFNTAIAACGNQSGDDFCGYYLNTLETNAHDGPWPDVGAYKSTQQFWGEIVDVEAGDGLTLRKIVIHTTRSSRDETEEFFFDQQGHLQFYYFKMMAHETIGQELRFYFKNGKLVDYKENVTADELAYQQCHREDFAKILKDAQGLLTAYKAQFR